MSVAPHEPTEPIEPDGSDRVHHALFLNRWDTLTFLHWRYHPAVVQRLLPRGLTVDTYEDEAWVALVPFEMQRVRPVGVPAVPVLSTFCETNVRTYVHDAKGRRGVYFFSLDASRLAMVIGARTSYGVPYVWSKMSLLAHGERITYQCRRRWPGPRGATSRVVVRLGEPGPEPGTDPLVDFLTARWSNLGVRRDRVRWTPVAHAPWRLRLGELVDLHDDLVPAAGLPAPTGAPLVHFSAGVDARIGRPRP